MAHRIRQRMQPGAEERTLKAIASSLTRAGFAVAAIVAALGFMLRSWAFIRLRVVAKRPKKQ